MRPIITLLTDFGTADGYVGEMKAVLLSAVPEATLVDVSHDIAPQDTEGARLALAPYSRRYPPGTVHLVVVDPGVGSDRAALAVASNGRFLVGPDSGVLSPALVVPGAEVVRLEIPPSAAPTFHGRDVFAPVAAHLATGLELADAGDPLDPETLARVELPQPREEAGAVVAHALVIDHFGNVGLNVGHDRLAGTGITLGGRVDVEAHGERYVAIYAQTFADVSPGELLVYQDAYRTLALAINRGDAAGTLSLGPDAEVRLRPR